GERANVPHAENALAARNAEKREREQRRALPAACFDLERAQLGPSQHSPMADTAVTLVDVEAWRGGGGDGAPPPDPAAPSTGAGSPARKTPASLTASTSRSLYSAEDLSEQNPQRSSSAQADPPVTTKKELYLYAPTLLQLLATAAGHRPDDPSQPCDGADANASCFVSFGPIGDISVSSMVLFTQGMSFLLLAVICAFFGALADYAGGRLPRLTGQCYHVFYAVSDYGRRILLVMTVVAVAAQLVPLAITEPGTREPPRVFDHQWYLMAIFNIIISVSIGATIVYYTAAFPNLAANMPLVRKAQSEAKEAASLLSAEDGTTRAVAEAKMRAAERVTMLARNEISSTSNAALSL
ncbi:MAG: vacuole effluxer Atg22 like-domain-containing protein, partial [Olpidium bornovanus]